MFQTSQPGTRSVFKSAYAEMAAANIPVQTAVLCQSELRSEILLTTTSTTYQVPILINQNPYAGGPYITEKRLNLQDAFVVGTIGMFLIVPTGAGDYATPLYSYPSLGAGFTAAEQRTICALYNGYMTLNVSQKTLIPYWDLWKHWKVNQTQATVGVTAQTVFPIDEADFTTDGFYPVEPSVLHIGSTNILMQINLPQAIASLPSALTRLVIIQRGILAQNVTSATNN
jgi:hypothetical protein